MAFSPAWLNIYFKVSKSNSVQIIVQCEKLSFTLCRQHVLTCDIIPDLAGFNIHSTHNVTVNTHSLAWQEEQHIIIGVVTEQLSLGTAGWSSMVDTTVSVSAPNWCTVTSANTTVQDCQVYPQSLSLQTRTNTQFRNNHMTLKVIVCRIWPSWFVEVSLADPIIICAQCDWTAAVFYDCLDSPATAAVFFLRKPHMSQHKSNWTRYRIWLISK